MSGFGVFSAGGAPRVGWRRDDRVLDLAAAGLGDVFAAPSLNAFLARGRRAWEGALERIEALPGDAPSHALADVELHVPFVVADYVDFSSSLDHAANLGRILRPGTEPVLPSWRRLPIGYHGRSGTVVVSGTGVVRPYGQLVPAGAEEPVLAPTAKLDFELELGYVVGMPSRLGEPVPAGAFPDHVFGVVLVNDWSARDLQAWEYRPLGPFVSKAFATTVSAWVTPLALLGPLRVSPPPQEPEPLPYLAAGRDWALDLDLAVELNGTSVTRGNARTLYWTMPQQLAHLTISGASLRTGDLLATGTISGPERGSEGSLLELTRDGREPVRLDGAGERAFLEDGDTVVLRGGGHGIELGEARGRVLPARPPIV